MNRNISEFKFPILIPSLRFISPNSNTSLLLKLPCIQKCTSSTSISLTYIISSTEVLPLGRLFDCTYKSKSDISKTQPSIPLVPSKLYK